jgi:ankyrin repeat protein
MASTRDDLFAAIDGGDVDAVRSMLDEEPSLASSRDAEGVSALMRARYRFDRALVAALKPHVSRLDVFEAASFGDLDRVTALLDADPSLANARSGDGFTVLHFAAFFGQVDAVTLLVERGAELDGRGSGWMTGTALHSAASGSHADIVQILLEAGADPNVRQSGGWTPLHSAAGNGDAETVRILLAHGADVSATSEDGRDARSLADESGDPDTIALLGAQADA